MAARDYFEAAFNEREDMYNALINSDRYHKCETFRAYSLRGTDFYSKIPKCYEDDTGGVKCS